jgi:hypothetical protein
VSLGRTSKAVFALASLALASCGEAGAALDDSALGAEVERIVQSSCAFQTCHGFMVANARMDLMKNGAHAAWVDVAACEYDHMLRVKPGHPEQSWVMVKLSGPVHFEQYADFIDFTPDADWRAGASGCTSSQFDDGRIWFGTRMPPQDTSSIASEDIETIRTWIARGAP